MFVIIKFHEKLHLDICPKCKLDLRENQQRKQVCIRMSPFSSRFFERKKLFENFFVKISFDETPSCVNNFSHARILFFRRVFVNNSGYHNENFQMPSGGSKSHFYHGYLDKQNEKENSTLFQT